MKSSSNISSNTDYKTPSPFRERVGVRVMMVVLALLLLTACESVDCTLNNTVSCYFAFCDSEGNDISLQDTLSILTEGTDSIILNRAVRRHDFQLPMSYYAQADTLHLHVFGETTDLWATLCIQKENTPHYESPDCPTNMFHTITGVDWERGSFIDSVAVKKANVNFQQDENIRIYLHTAP